MARYLLDGSRYVLGFRPNHMLRPFDPSQRDYPLRVLAPTEAICLFRRPS
jgi:hypothetical protein